MSAVAKKRPTIAARPPAPPRKPLAQIEAELREEAARLAQEGLLIPVARVCGRVPNILATLELQADSPNAPPLECCGTRFLLLRKDSSLIDLEPLSGKIARRGLATRNWRIAYMCDDYLRNARLYCLSGTLNAEQLAAANARADTLPATWRRALPNPDFGWVRSLLDLLE